VLLLRALPAAWKTFAVFRVFEGDYLSGLLFVLGLALLLIHRKWIASLWHFRYGPLLAAAIAALVLSVLLYGWLDLTVSEAWITPARWLRFPAIFLAVLPYHTAEELLIGSWRARPGKWRLLLGLGLRAAIWAALLIGVLLLNNGEILLLLMAPYIAIFCLFQRTGMDVVRRSTGSPLAAALFGAILLAGFSVVVFPII
jgi:hypothetical protein